MLEMKEWTEQAKIPALLKMQSSGRRKAIEKEMKCYMASILWRKTRHGRVIGSVEQEPGFKFKRQLS